MMIGISDVFILDVSDNKDIPYRDEKFCVCVSVLNNKCLLISTKNRGIYDELEINSSDYEQNGKTCFVACRNVFDFKESEIIRRLGSLSNSNMVKIINKLKAKKKRQLDNIILELDKWLENYTKNKLTAVFRNR